MNDSNGKILSIELDLKILMFLDFALTIPARFLIKYIRRCNSTFCLTKWNELRVITNDIPSFEKILEEKLGLIEEIGQLQTSVVIAIKKDSKVAPLNYAKELILNS